MKKFSALLLLGAVLLSSLTACGGQTPAPSAAESTRSETTILSSDAAATSSTAAETPPAPAARKLKMTVNGQTISVVLYDTPTADALYEALPMELDFSDYNGTEKIAYPPAALPTAGEPDGCDPAIGDLCLYAPWGNLCVFYRDFRYSPSLIKLGHVENGMDVLSGMNGDFTVTLERAA